MIWGYHYFWKHQNGILRVAFASSPPPFFFFKEGLSWWHSKLTPDQCGGGVSVDLSDFCLLQLFWKSKCSPKHVKVYWKTISTLTLFPSIWDIHLWDMAATHGVEGWWEKQQGNINESNSWVLFFLAFCFPLNIVDGFRNPAKKTTWDVYKTLVFFMG